MREKKKPKLVGGRELPRFRDYTVINGCTYEEFAVFVKRSNVDIDYLCSAMRGNTERERASSLIDRIIHGEPNWDVVIPYRSLIDVFVQGVEAQVELGLTNLCACGKCALPVLSRSRTSFAIGCPNR